LTPDDRIVTLGDYIDRGPDSRGVLERLIGLHAEYSVVSLRGNHEMMMLAARESQDYRQFWLSVGGLEAIQSFSRAGRLDDVPATHWHFLRHICVDRHETDR